MINVIYFGVLKDLSGCAQEQLDWQEANSDELLKQLRARGSDWAEALSDKNIFRLVVNKQIIYEPTLLKKGDEIAILPPVTGG